MSIDEKTVQLEFPFLNKIRMQMYAKFQLSEMMSVYNLHYRFDGDYGKEMKFGDFVADIWIKGGFAKKFHETYYKVYFHDVINNI